MPRSENIWSSFFSLSVTRSQKHPALQSCFILLFKTSTLLINILRKYADFITVYYEMLQHVFISSGTAFEKVFRI